MKLDFEKWIERHPIAALLLLAGFVVLLSLRPGHIEEAECRPAAKESVK